MPAALGRGTGLRHQLSAGQMAMVAVGGSIGTGLLLGSAAALEIAGPGVILQLRPGCIYHSDRGPGIWANSRSMHPGGRLVRGCMAIIYLNQWAGFIARAGYWAAISISDRRGAGGFRHLSAYTGFLSRSVWSWVLIFFRLLLLINLAQRGNYARFEYWFAMIKVANHRWLSSCWERGCC